MFQDVVINQKPEINLNFDAPSLSQLKKLTLKKLVTHLSSNCSKEPNFSITLSVLECLMYIQLNEPFIRYAIQNKNTDPDIYKNQHDQVKQVLRAPNDLAFHIMSYNDPDKAYQDYTRLIQSIEHNTEFLIANPSVCKTFISKIIDSDVGCMEVRIADALLCLIDWKMSKLDDLVEHFFKQKSSPQDPCELAIYFENYVGTMVLYANQEQILTWDLIKSYFKTHMAYEDKDFQLTDDSLNSLEPKILVNNKQWFLYSYASRQEANAQLAVIKYVLAESHPELIQYGNVVATPQYPQTPYRFRLSKNQHEALMKQKEAVTNKQIEDKDYLIKSLRFDDKCFLNTFLNSITHTQDKSVEKRSKLRPGAHNMFTVTGNGWYKYHEKPSSYSPGELSKKDYLSRHQSTTLITKDTQAPVFGFNSARKEALVGVILDPKDALFNRFYIYDGGTVSRPYEFAQESDAKKYYEDKINTVLFKTYTEFKKAIANKTDKHNEVLARIRWNPNSSSVGIFTDTFESRCIAQIYAEKIEKKLESKAGKLPEPWVAGYRVPIYYYLPTDPKKNLTAYTKIQQETDRVEAARILANSTEREKLFKEGFFAFLLLAPEEKKQEVLKIIWNGNPIIIELIGLKLFHIAEFLVERAGVHSLYDYVKHNNLLDQAALKFEKNDTCLFDAVLSERIDLIKTILEFAPHLMKQKNSEGQTPIEFASKKGHWESVLVLAEHKIDTKDEARYGAALIYAVRANKHDVARILLIAGTPQTWNTRPDENYPLHHAVLNNKPEMIKLLLSKNPDVSVKNKNGETPIEVAANKGHWECVLVLAEHKNDTKNEAHSGAALVDAVRANEYAVASTLLIAGTSQVWKTQPDKNYALHHAVLNNKPEMIKLLLSKHPDVSVKNKEGQTPIELAVKKEYWKCVLALAEHINNTEDEAHYGSILVEAVRANQYVVARTLVIAGASQAWRTESNKNYALHLAVLNNNPKMLQLLFFSNDCDFAVKNKESHTPIQLAAYKGHLECVLALIDHKNDTEDESYFGAALLQAVCANHYVVTKTLVDKGASQSVPTLPDENYPLHHAVLNNKPEMIKLLLSKNPDVSVKNKKGETPIEVAANKGHWECVLVLAEHKNDTKDEAHSGAALLDAVRANEYDVASTLLIAGASQVWKTQPDENYALHHAVLNKNPEMIKLLLSKSCSLSVKNKEGKTPTQLARDNGQLDCVQALVSQRSFNGIDSMSKNYSATCTSKSEMDLYVYLEERSADTALEYKCSLNFFCHKINFGFDKQSKVAAAKAVIDWISAPQENKSNAFQEMLKHKAACTNGTLGSIYKKILVERAAELKVMSGIHHAIGTVLN